MAEPRSIDRYDEAAAAKLWALLPAVHRSEDSPALDEVGPLHELLIRLGRQVGVVRRSMDRLWEDQSIETCDDWVIPYIAALVDTNLVPAMQARGQRLDVANTIDYRRRKGTLGLVEQLAADVTGWECRAVEMFRRLGRAQHGLDPAIGRPADAADPGSARRLQRAQGLTGPLTGTPAGGYADLRSAAGAAAAHGPFDELHHRVDVRLGEGASGWYGISKIGLFLWQLVSLEVDRATPVAVTGCSGHYAFDPTGRLIALWQADDRPQGGYAEGWRPLAAWQVPGPMSQELTEAVRTAGKLPPPPGAYPDAHASLWPRSVAVRPLFSATALAQDDVSLWPDVGRFAVPAGTGNLEVSYHHGRPSRIGADCYDRRRIGVPIVADPGPVTPAAGGTLPDRLHDALGALGDSGTVVVTDGLTCTAVAPVGPLSDVAIRAEDARRAVIRLVRGDGPWVLRGSKADAETSAHLRLEGLLFSGEDIVLRGGFEEVVLTCCTIDPGTRGDLREPPLVWNLSVDKRELAASRLWIEGTVRRLVVDRCITGPIRTRAGGVVQELCVNDSVLQGLPVGDGLLLTPGQVFDPGDLARMLRDTPDALTAWIAEGLDPATTQALKAHVDGTPLADDALKLLVDDLNAVLKSGPIWDAERFADRGISAAAIAAAEAGPPDDMLIAVNRRLLAEAFRLELGDAAVAAGAGVVALTRSTVLGALYAHRLECSESIIDDVAIVDDAQDGCVRFSAWPTGSALPRKYESVRVAPRAPLFVSRRFGEAGYAQLAAGADAAILGATTAGTPSIAAGSHDGSEMGAFCRDGVAVKVRSLLIKLKEYLPVGLTPVVVPMPPSDADAETTRGRPWPPT
jgi:hypothetical protein